MSIPIRPGKVDWGHVDRLLGETYGVTPSVVDEMTLSEIAILLDQKGRLSGERKMADDEIVAHAIRRRGMSPRQKLEERLRRG